MRKVFKWTGLLIVAALVAFGISWLIYMPNSTERGVWRHEADGTVLDLNRLTATLYHQTSFDCAQTMVFPAHMAIVKATEGAWIEAEGDALTITVDGNIASSHFSRLEALPDACSAPKPATPHNVFMAMWTMMDEHYPFFDLYGVDWQERRALAPGPNDLQSDADLFATMQTALTGLDDGHVQLIANEQGYFSPSLAPEWMPDTAVTRAALNRTAGRSIGANMFSVPDSGVSFGLREDGIGYILIDVMWNSTSFGQLESDRSAEVFAFVAEALAEARAIIVDVRFNPGGTDGTALAYASFFTDRPVTVLSKRTRQGDGWTAPVEAVVTPSQTHFLSQPVILLTSGLTGSGAEIFTMAMREMPQVTVMGEPTGGGLSDILGTTLPNGWLFGLSHQEYLTPDGSLYEGTGIPVDIDVATTARAVAAEDDVVLQAAIEHALTFE